MANRRSKGEVSVTVNDDMPTKRRDILMAARKMFAQFGRKTSMDDIAKIAQVSKKTIYNHFRSKEELFRAVVDCDAIILIQVLQNAVRSQPTIRGKLNAYVATKISKLKEFINFYNVTRETVIDFWPEVHGMLERYTEMEKDIILDILQEGIRRDELVISDPELAAYSIVLALRGYEASWLNRGLNFDLEQSIGKLLDILFNGIRKR